MNNERHVHDIAWRDLLSELLGNDLFVAAMSNWVRSTIDHRGRWWFDRFGGDTVLPGDPGQDLHSDYWGYNMHTIAVSIAVSDSTEDAAPMRIIPGLAPAKNDDKKKSPHQSLCHKVLIPRGSVFIRDVNVWHSGTPNSSCFTRILPSIRFVTDLERLPLRYSSLAVSYTHLRAHETDS